MEFFIVSVEIKQGYLEKQNNNFTRLCFLIFSVVNMINPKLLSGHFLFIFFIFKKKFNTNFRINGLKHCRAKVYCK